MRDRKDYEDISILIAELEVALNLKQTDRITRDFQKLDAFYHESFVDVPDSFKSVELYFRMQKASMRFFAFNNFFNQVHITYDDLCSRFKAIETNRVFTNDKTEIIRKIMSQAEQTNRSIPENHKNQTIPRYDYLCCLCRNKVANKTGSHMVPNFLSHPTFSWNGVGKRGHEALNHFCLNSKGILNTFYGAEVPAWRFAMGNGSMNVSDEDIANNINQLEFDNEFCSTCENRFGLLESAYSQYYNGQKHKINPRLSFLFWLSVVWRMAISRMGIFMNIDDEFHLREILDSNIKDTANDIEKDNSDLGDWRYAIFRASNLREGDKGILGSRMESSPYVTMYNDVVMVFFNHNPSDEELTVGPLVIERDMLCDWRKQERCSSMTRRQFWNVRDWIVETSYDYYDPAREGALLVLREKQRTSGKDVCKDAEDLLIATSRISTPSCASKPIRVHKMVRIFYAYLRANTTLVDGKPYCPLVQNKFTGTDSSEFAENYEEISRHVLISDALLKGEQYDPLADEDLFLSREDFEKYYKDLANLARHMGLEYVFKLIMLVLGYRLLRWYGTARNGVLVPLITALWYRYRMSVMSGVKRAVCKGIVSFSMVA